MMQRIGLLSFLVFTCGCAHTPEAEPAPQPMQAQMPAPLMQVVTLKHASADELGSVIAKALSAAHRKGVRIVADPRTNSLVLTGESDADLATALELIEKLDVEATKAP